MTRSAVGTPGSIVPAAQFLHILRLICLLESDIRFLQLRRISSREITVLIPGPVETHINKKRRQVLNVSSAATHTFTLQRRVSDGRSTVGLFPEAVYSPSFLPTVITHSVLSLDSVRRTEGRRRGGVWGDSVSSNDVRPEFEQFQHFGSVESIRSSVHSQQAAAGPVCPQDTRPQDTRHK